MTATVTQIITRGQVWLADLGKPIGSEQGGIRPVLVIQNNMGNKYSPVITCCPLTSSKTKRGLPTHVLLKDEIFLPEKSEDADDIRIVKNERGLYELQFWDWHDYDDDGYSDCDYVCEKSMIIDYCPLCGKDLRG